MSRRTDRVNELLKREISGVLQRDFEWDGSLVTVNAVEVSQDLKDAKVFIGVLGGHEGKVISRLNREHGSIQGRVMKRVVLKNTPVLRFLSDDSVVRGVDIVNLLDEVAELPKAPQEEEE
ncbi:MAG: 30S ribosome-binding factor RbfA [Roseibacillus sp.]|jgi:ribosome-binding factor A|nr:ribosome-binding factor A [Roseibacillus sp.]MCP4731549.1 30S ribosome-binding factor RbfA [Roseibacillus sp.]MDP7307996.1 30S ribosome-binding factor RbfA [Roseibacillus sp.]MDP7655008.1 30S ribosome-binding factor RbfA [Roseibacillus sp.]HJM63358.1 30S ribosome-binding factor RbfA [Roseibacillus sp.]|tara:strand:- start:14471 stop:14830 length:360 start_codon:yes stop_codon:yes gene_type:complete